MKNMKILIKSTYNTTNYYVHAYETWKKSLEKYSDIYYYGEGYPNFFGWDISDNELYDKLGIVPDIELWCGGSKIKPQYNNNDYILKPNKHIPKLILLNDYWDIKRNSNVGAWSKREHELKNMGVIGYFSYYPQSEEWMVRVVNTIFKKFVIFPYVYDDKFTEYNNLDRVWDINNQGANFDRIYPLRNKIKKYLDDNKNIKTFGIDGDHKYKILDKDNDPLESFFNGGGPVNNFAKLLNSCWITITCGYSKYTYNRDVLKFDDSDLFLAKFPQTMSSNSVLFCPKITSTHIGVVSDGEHYVEIDSNNFGEKISYYLNNKDKLIEISQSAKKWALDNCSSDIVGEKIINKIRNIINK